jgi:pentatricopeptide repeat protein
MQAASTATRANLRNALQYCWINARLTNATTRRLVSHAEMASFSSLQSHKVYRTWPVNLSQSNYSTTVQNAIYDEELKPIAVENLVEHFKAVVQKGHTNTSVVYDKLRRLNKLNQLDTQDFASFRAHLWSTKAWGSEELVEQVLFDQKSCGHAWSVLEYNDYYMSMLFQAKYNDIVSNFEEDFSSTEIKPTVATINAVLAAYIQMNQIDKARGLMAKCGQWELTPTIQDFERLANRCLPRNAKVAKEARMLILNNALKEPKAMNRHLQNLFRANKLPEIQKLYSVMRKDTNAIDISTYSTLIKGYLDKRKYEEVNKIYDEVCGTRRPLNAFVASLMLDAYAAQRDRVQIANIVERMRKDNVIMDIPLYNQLIKAFFSTKQVGLAVAIFQQLQKDQHAELNTVVLNTMINGLLQNREIDAAKKVYSDMLKSKIQPDMVTYNTLLKGLTKTRDFEGALGVLNNLYERSLEPDIVTYTTLIDAMFENLNPTSTEEIMRIFKNPKGVKPNVFTYNVLINGWIRHDNMQEAERTYKMLLDSQDIQPTVHTYTNIIQGYVQNHNVSKAMSAFQTMLSNGIQPGRATYHFIISGLINDGRLNDAVECLKRMRLNGKMPTKDTWFMVLNACYDSKNSQLGSSVLKELDDSKFDVRSEALRRVYRLVRDQSTT